AIRRFGPGNAFRHASLRGDLDDLLQIVRQLVPRRPRYDQFARRCRLMPARRVIELGRVLKAHTAILIGADEFCGIDDTTLKSGEDLATRKHAGIDAELAIHLAGKARNAHAQTLQVVDALDRLAEPAG